MKESTKDKFEQAVQQLALVFQISPQEFKSALWELQSFDKVILMVGIAEEMGIPLWEAISEGKEIINHHYDQTQKEVKNLWSSVSFH